MFGEMLDWSIREMSDLLKTKKNTEQFIEAHMNSQGSIHKKLRIPRIDVRYERDRYGDLKLCYTNHYGKCLIVPDKQKLLVSQCGAR